MSDFMSLKLSCESWEQIVSASNSVVAQLPRSMRSRFNSAFSAAIVRHRDMKGVFEHLNNRTVGSILSEYENKGIPKPISSGEVDGVKYELFESSDKETENN